MINKLLEGQTKCPVCRKTQIRLWGERNGYLLYRCLLCTHRFADLKDREISQDDLNLFREGITNGLMSGDQEYYEHLCKGEGLGLPTTITADHVLELYLKERPVGGSWLDVGCGAGYLMYRANDVGFCARGIEPGGWGQIAAMHKNLNVVQGFLTPDTFPGHFDVISATDVVEHTPDPVSFLKLIADYLLVGGHAIISIPFFESAEARLMGLRWNMIEPPTHSQFFSSQSLQLALNQAGFEIISSRQYNIRYLLGFARFKIVRKIIDTVFSGPQLICLMRKIK
jgi:SAM-dependent methyltransferase